jgi:regulator of telomere elongation helicase 1
VWQEALKVVFHPSNRNDKQSFARNYKLYVHMESQQSKQQTQKSLWSSAPKSIGGRILSFWCFSSGVTMRQLIQGKCRSIILASGTLSPLDSFAAELQM